MFDDRLHVKLGSSLKEQANKVAEDRGITLSELVRELLARELKRSAQKRKNHLTGD